MISVKGLEKYFNKGRQNEIHVINNVTLEFPERGMVAIFGKSGCGKTTLLNVIGGLDGFAEGSLFIEGNDIRTNTDEIRNRYIGYIFQNYNLSKNESCYDNVANALKLCGVTDPDEIEERVKSALSNVGMEKYAKRTPDTLSGGQQQRVAIARAIVKNPRIILADEPTGNLDESNTVMVMDLLKAIAKDHLVILVTHEAKLVDYYCDTVIELSDGKVASVRSNDSAVGYSEKDKNHIYLGEFEKSELSDDNAIIEYYGDKPQSPIRLKIVNKMGKMYIKVCTSGVHAVDDTGEIKLIEGVFEEKKSETGTEREIDMTKLNRPVGNCFGRLFSFASSVKSGLFANFKTDKKNKLLRRCLTMLSAIVVFMSATFGTSIGTLSDAKNAYNNKVFYVYTENTEVSKKINDAVGREDTAIDYIRLDPVFYMASDADIYFHVGSFETFNDYNASSNFSSHAVFLGESLMAGAPLIAGKNTELKSEEIVLSSRVADDLLERSNLGYISDYDDLIGMLSWSFTVDGKNLRVVGIVESDEFAIYMTELSVAEYARRWSEHSATAPASKSGIHAADGEAVLLIPDGTSASYPGIGEKIKIQGVDITVSDIVIRFATYDSWLISSEITKKNKDEYFRSLLAAEKPELIPDSDEFKDELSGISNERYFEYFDYYYSDVESYIDEIYLFGDMNAWVYVEKGIKEASYYMFSEEYVRALAYKAANGYYPSKTLYDRIKDEITVDDILPSLDAYYDEYYMSFVSYVDYYGTYMVSDKDYITMSKQIGETHSSAKSDREYAAYTVIHSTDPQKTEEWILREFADLENDYYQAVYTPDMIFENEIADASAQITGQLIALVVIIAIMCICMYFIVRSSLLSRVKEIGIYRAIGVSKKNMIFKFFTEAAVLTAMTVVIGYILSSAFMFVVIGSSPLVSEIFYYPLWFAALVFLILVVVGILCGILPISLLLRKKPSEILAKYDI